MRYWEIISLLEDFEGTRKVIKDEQMTEDEWNYYKEITAEIQQLIKDLYIESKRKKAKV